MTDKPMRYIELFAGAGGMSRGLEAAGLVCLAHAEIEPHAQAVLRQHWPDTPLHGDVTQVDWTIYAGQVEVVAGGSPCQDLSVAGKRAGLAGARSGLFYELLRAWDETGATYCLWENVDGARSSNHGGDFAAVLSAFVGTALPVPSDGWRSSGVAAGPTGVAAWRVLDLQHFGPPQRRRRLFVVAARAGGADPAEVLALSEGVCGHPSPRQQQRERAAAGTGASPTSRSVGVTLGIDGEKNVDVELLGALNIGSKSGSGQQPAVMTFAERGREGGRSVEVRDDGVLNSLMTPNGGRSGTGCGDAVLAFESTGGSWGVNAGDTSPPIKIGTGMEIASPPAVVTAALGVVAFPIDTRNATRTTDQSEQNRQGVGIGDAGDPSPTLTSLFVPAVIALDGTDTVGSLLASGDSSPCVEIASPPAEQTPVYRMVAFGEYAEDGTASTIKQRDYKDATDLVTTGRPRRLTPLECERLMSWPDQWTAIGRREDGSPYALSDTARYRLCGNGVGSVCATWIATRLNALHA